ncbi:MAG: hypothetical protein RL150_277 [Candidatus Parcubacteria bacterium]|jgi:hypothetical protein
MKKIHTLLIAIIAIVAAAFLQHRGYADDQPTPTAAPATTAEVTGPPTPAATPTQPIRPARTFAYAGELQQILAKATGGDGEVVTLSAGCALETHSDGSYTDISSPEHPKAYGPDNTYIDVAVMTPEEIAKAPMSARRTLELLATAASDEDAG